MKNCSGGGCSHRQILNSHLPTDTPNWQLNMEELLLKRPSRTVLSQETVKEDNQDGRREKDAASPNPHLQYGNPQWEGSHKSEASLQGVEGWCPTLGTPSLETCTGETNPQNVWFWKTMGLMSRKSKGLQGTVILLLMSSRADSLAPRSNKKASVCKATRLYVKKIHLLILKYLSEGQGPVGTLSRDGGAGGHHFVLSIYLVKASGHALACIFLPPH